LLAARYIWFTTESRGGFLKNEASPSGFGSLV